MAVCLLLLLFHHFQEPQLKCEGNWTDVYVHCSIINYAPQNTCGECGDAKLCETAFWEPNREFPCALITILQLRLNWRGNPNMTLMKWAGLWIYRNKLQNGGNINCKSSFLEFFFIERGIIFAKIGPMRWQPIFQKCSAYDKAGYSATRRLDWMAVAFVGERGQRAADRNNNNEMNVWKAKFGQNFGQVMVTIIAFYAGHGNSTIIIIYSHRSFRSNTHAYENIVRPLLLRVFVRLRESTQQTLFPSLHTSIQVVSTDVDVHQLSLHESRYIWENCIGFYVYFWSGIIV